MGKKDANKIIDMYKNSPNYFIDGYWINNF